MGQPKGGVRHFCLQSTGQTYHMAAPNSKGNREMQSSWVPRRKTYS